MQFNALALAAVLGLSGQAAGLRMQLLAGPMQNLAGLPDQTITLKDYATGSTWEGRFSGWDQCISQNRKCMVGMSEISGGGYNFYILTYRDSNGCHWIDLQHHLNGGSEVACGPLPKDIVFPYSPPQPADRTG